VANHLKMADRQRIQALLELGWSHRRIAREAGVDRETVARYARAGPSNPANLIVGEKPSSSGSSSPAAVHDAFIRQGIKSGLSAQRIWQDLVEQHGYGHGYLTVQRYVRRLRGRREVSDHMEHPPGQEALCGFPHGISSPGSCSISIVGPCPRRLEHASRRGRSLRRRTSRANVT